MPRPAGMKLGTDRPWRWPVACLVVFLAASGARTRADDGIEFNRDVRSILSENCFLCHGPDSGSRKADLRLDRRADALKAEAFVPGDADSSTLVERIFSDDPKQLMPPPESTKALTLAQKETLKRWIQSGAEYQPHWSFLPPKRSAPPQVKDESKVRNPIDRFILAKLDSMGLSSQPEADRRTLARRLSLDLTGLPPSAEDVEAFVNDASPDAYEKLIDKWMNSPRWGEHRARYWLDAARYADTHGIHFDNYRDIWSYRDWVINALNRNMPFDRFTIEQLAGDLLPNRTLDQQVASGFNRCHITTNEGGAINEEYLVLYTRDRTETVSQVWLGLTAGCAVCHDHKYDPLSQKEFYELSAFFNNTTQGAMDGNIQNTPPVLFVPSESDRPRWESLTGELAEAKKRIETRKQDALADFEGWLNGDGPSTLSATIPTDGLRVRLRLDDGPGEEIALDLDGKSWAVDAPAGTAWAAGHVGSKAYESKPGSVLELGSAGDFEKDKGFSYGAWIKLPSAGVTGAILARMDDQHDYRGFDLWIEGGRVGTHIISTWQADALKVVSTNPLKAGLWHHVFITYDGSARASGVKVYIDGEGQKTGVQADALKSSIRTEVPLKLAQRNGSARIDGALIEDVRLYDRNLSGDEVGRIARGTRVAWLASKPKADRTPAEADELFQWWLGGFDVPTRDLKASLAKLEAEQAAIKSRGTDAYVMQEKPQEPMAYMLFRGDYDKRRDAVKPGTPAILPPMPSDLPRNRLGFAEWLLRPDHPLTARVTVNRFWQELFGSGLVRTAGDFGVSGEPPSHPELLDWLAVEFREQGWDIKKFYKMMFLSATYRQSAATTRETLEKDPTNRFLSRGPRFRMDAEMVRDYALAASGTLSTKIGGPSVRPYQPEGVWEAVAMPGSSTRNYVQDHGDSLYRRSMYTLWKRAAPPASMDIFNAPPREVCTVRRERTNTPLQALVTLNDPQFVEAARNLAERAIKSGESPDARVDFLVSRLLARPIKPEERAIILGSIAELTAYYAAHPEDATKLISQGESKPDPKVDAKTLASWTMLANELLNLDEVLNK